MTRLDALPPAQRAFWDEHLAAVPPGWVLYGGTAIALHLGHRQSLDFDFFSPDDLNRKALRRSSRVLEEAKTLQDEPNTLTVAADIEGQPVKLSFFGGIGLGRVGEPVRIAGLARIASRTRAAAAYDPATSAAVKRSDRLD